jgi:tetratricopeptide (TPR) repeat protein
LIACQRQLHQMPTPEDLALGVEAIQLGELLRRFGHAENPVVLRILGLAYNMAGDHSNAVARLEPALQIAASAEAWEMTAALADSYAQLGRLADARRILERATTDPKAGDIARRMLQALDAAGSSPR